ncbi:MAG: NAD(+)/NADH kinase [Clostridia bacterium]|nr:NAD(+)/NADH kinase [Clostridia bacterium]
MKIALITNPTKDIGLVSALRAAELLRGRAELFMSNDCRLTGDRDVTYLPYEQIWKTVDTAIVIGGDGTLLRVATQCAKNSIPALGINLGKVGFLTEVDPGNMEAAFDALLSGEYIKERRMLLKIRVNDEDVSYQALNDTVISKTDNARLISMDLYTDGELVNHYVGDGLIIATPTGSTGYSISAGGPVVDPRMELYVATPICAHMLAVRSAVLSAERELTLRLGRDYADNCAKITTDGERQRFISPEDELRITRSDYKFELIRLGTQSFYNTLISKLS